MSADGRAPSTCCRSGRWKHRRGPLCGLEGRGHRPDLILALEDGESLGITVNCVAPGLVMTLMLWRSRRDPREDRRQGPDGRNRRGRSPASTPSSSSRTRRTSWARCSSSTAACRRRPMPPCPTARCGCLPGDPRGTERGWPRRWTRTLPRPAARASAATAACSWPAHHPGARGPRLPARGAGADQAFQARRRCDATAALAFSGKRRSCPAHVVDGARTLLHLAAHFGEVRLLPGSSAHAGIRAPPDPGRHAALRGPGGSAAAGSGWAWPSAGVQRPPWTAAP